MNIHYLSDVTMSKVVSESEDFTGASESEESVKLLKPVNFKLLLRHSQYSALSKLKDSTNSEERLRSRRHILEMALKDIEFLSKACQIISTSLKWKEDSWKATYEADKWLSFESAKLVNVRNAGTLTESAWRTIKREVTHAFACLLAFADRDGNLNNYGSSKPKKLWLDLLSCAFACDSEFKRSCEDAMRVSEQTAEFVVSSSAVDRHDFHSLFPFSWAIFERIRILAKEDHERLVDLFRNADFGVILQRHVFDEDLLLNFCHDMLNIELFEADGESVKTVSQMLVRSSELTKDSLPDAMSSSFLVLRKFKQQVQIALKLKNRVKGLDLKISEVQTLEDLPEAVFKSFWKHFEKHRTHLNTAEKRKTWQSWLTDSQPLICRLLLMNGSEDMQLQWDRIQCVFLFLTEVVNAFDSETSISESDIKPIQLWNALHRELREDFQSLKAIKTIEEFVEKVNSSLTEKILGSKNCGKCGNRSDYKLILPCADRLCADCVTRSESSSDDPRKKICPICKQAFDPSAVTGPKQQALVDFKARCNRFMMQVVSKLCFRANRPPNEDLCHHLISYVTRTAKTNAVFGLFGDDRDSSPVFRSFVLQKLLAFNVEKVECLLQQHVNAAASDLKEDATQDLAMIIVNCMEDAEFMRHQAKPITEHDLLYKAVSMLDEFASPEEAILLSVPHLRMVAFRRVALRVLATEFSRGNLCEKFVNELARALEAHKWSRVFFVRCLSMEVGVSAAIGLILSKPAVRVAMEEEIGDIDLVPVPDFLVSHSDGYRKAKEYVLTTYYDASHKDTGITDDMSSTLVLAALTAAYKIQNMTEEKPENFQLCIDRLKSTFPAPHKALYETLVYLTESPLSDANVAMLRIHLAYLLQADSAAKCSSAFRKFLKDLPSFVNNWFLPAMTHDEIWERLLEMTNCPITTKDSRGKLRDENFKMYCCPNGHPYVLGECTQGWVKYKCHECGADIGGQSHVIAANNTEYTCKTKKGFSTPSEKEGTQPMRNLTAASAALIRLLQHLALLAASRDSNCSLSQFHSDVSLFSQVTGRSAEETYHILHLVLNRLELDRTILDSFDGKSQNGEGSCKIKGKDIDLKTDQGRRNFEECIDRELIQPIMSQLSDLLQNSNRLIAQSGSEIMQLIHGTSKLDETNEASLWKCHRRITVKNAEYAFQELSTELSEQYRLIGTVWKWLPVLRHVGSLPQLIRLAKELTSCYNYSITIEDARRSSIQKAYNRSDNCEVDVNAFELVWNDLRHRLKLARFEDSPYPLLKSGVPACDLPLAALLPHSNEWGRCIVALAQLLVEAHNAVIDASAINTEEVSLDDLDQAAVIPKDLEAGLLPILLANSSYSIKDVARIEYDFQSLESQLVDFLARGRCRIAPLLTPIIYKDEIHLEQLFKRLQRSVPQNLAPSTVTLTQALSSGLPQELRDVTHYLDDALPAVIRFLISLAPENTQEMLHVFMTERLAMPGLPTPQLQRSVTLADTKLLWLHLDHLRCCLLLRSDLNPFEDCGEVPELPEELPKELKNQRTLLMEKLHSFIRLVLSKNRETYEGLELQDVVDLPNMSVEYEAFSVFDGSFLCDHAVAIWTALYRME